MDKVLKEDTRGGFGKALAKYAAINESIVSLDCDLGKSTRSYSIAEVDEDRFYEMGISEQDMISTAAGMASMGATVFASTFAIFLTGRGYDQIRQQVALPKMNVKLCGSSAGLTQGPDGATHQSLLDVGLMRLLPNMTVMIPADADQTEDVMKAAIEYEGPVYIRLSRFPTVKNIPAGIDFEMGKGQVLSEGENVVLCGTGPIMQEVNKAAVLLEKKGINVGVVNFHTVKPFDKILVSKLIEQYTTIVSIEEHSVYGGLGTAIAEVVSESDSNNKCNLVRHGVNDTFGESGGQMELLEKYKLDGNGIAALVEKI
jgi:transketolase